MGNNEPAVDQSDLRIRGSYGLNVRIYVRTIDRSIAAIAPYGRRASHDRI